MSQYELKCVSDFKYNLFEQKNVLNIKKYIILQAKYWVVIFRELARQIGSYFDPVGQAYVSWGSENHVNQMARLTELELDVKELQWT